MRLVGFEPRTLCFLSQILNPLQWYTWGNIYCLVLIETWVWLWFLSRVMVRMSFQGCSFVSIISSRPMVLPMQERNSRAQQSETCATTQSRINTSLSPKTFQSNNFFSKRASTSPLQLPRISYKHPNPWEYKNTSNNWGYKK